MQESLYLKVILWAYNRKQNPFSIEELYRELEIDPSDKPWITEMFLNAPQNTYPLFYLRISNASDYKYILSDKGMSAAMNYLLLKESQASGRQTKIIAYWSIGLSIIVGIAQIILTLVK